MSVQRFLVLRAAGCCAAEMFLQGPSTGHLQTASGAPHPLQGPPAARDFTVPGAHVFSSQPFVLPMGREFLTPPMHSEDVGDTQDGLLSNPLLMVVTTLTDPDWPVAEDCCLSPLCHPCLSDLPSPVFVLICLFKKTTLAEETCTTVYLMQIFLKCTDRYI